MRDRIFAIMEGDSDLWISRVISYIVMTAIIVSTVAFVLETVPEYNHKYRQLFWWLEVVIVAIFSVEYAIRWITVRGKLPFMVKPLNIVDLLAVLPFYLDLLLPLSGLDLRIVRVIRLIRVFRIFKLAKYSKSFTVTALAFKDGSFAMVALILLMSIVLIVSSTCMYFAEHISEVPCSRENCQGKWTTHDGSFDNPQCPECRAAVQLPVAATHFRSILSTFWWCIVTMTTVGYGDVVPQTALGKLIAAFTMICGILCIALPTGVVATTFSNRYQEMMKAETAETGAETESLVCPHCGQKLTT